MRNELLSRIDRARLEPVNRSLLRFGASQSDETAEVIRKSALSFPAKVLLDLNTKEISEASARLRSAFTRMARRRGLTIPAEELVFLEAGPDNGLAHEQAHLRVINELRPEVIRQSTINILPVLDSSEVTVAMNVMIPIPKVGYSTMEQARIQLAPHSPSEQDYYDLLQYMKIHKITSEEAIKVRAMLEKKKPSTGRDFLLNLLSEV